MATLASKVYSVVPQIVSAVSVELPQSLTEEGTQRFVSYLVLVKIQLLVYVQEAQEEERIMLI